jgi:hypothetical protein
VPVSKQLGWQIAYRRYRLQVRRRDATAWLAFRLPRSLVYWCAILLIAHATTGPHGSQVVPELRAMDALQRWDYDPHRRRRP